MTAERRHAGFLAALGHSRLASLAWPEGVIALVFGLGGGIALLGPTSVDERLSLVGDGLNLLGVLLGVVFAAFALLIALFSDDYVRALDKVEGGVISFMRPFMLALGLQVTTVLLTLAYRAGAAHLPSKGEVGLFLCWAFLLTYVIADVVALGRTVTMHGLARARQLRSVESQSADPTPIRRNR